MPGSCIPASPGREPAATMTLLRRLLPLLVLLSPLGACRTAAFDRDPTGEPFPSVRGRSLQGEEIRLPEDLAGTPAILLVGYDQDAQFDADRWLYGLLQADLDSAIYEVPTLPGLFPSAFAGTIDDGMRSGIPEEDWSTVVTLYGSDASPVVTLTGNERRRNMRVLLLDATGRVVWFHDRGFSAGKLIELERAVEGLR